MQLSFFSQKTTVARDLLERFLNIQYTKFETVVSLKILISVGCFFAKNKQKGRVSGDGGRSSICLEGMLDADYVRITNLLDFYRL